MPVKIIATQMLGKNLKPGDLFSTAPQQYWDTAMNKGSVGERVFIRTNISASQFADANSPVYKITLSIDNGDTND